MSSDFRNENSNEENAGEGYSDDNSIMNSNALECPNRAETIAGTNVSTRVVSSTNDIIQMDINQRHQSSIPIISTTNHINANYDIPLESNSDYDSAGLSHQHFETNLDEMFDNLTYLITSEKTKIQNEKINILKAQLKFKELKNQELLKLEKEKDTWKENLKIAESMNVKASDILDLDIGGTHKLTTTRSTLVKYPNSALAAMFSGRHEIAQHNGRLFIDRDGYAFTNMINYLRNGKFPVFKDKNEELNFYEELEFWQVPICDKKESTVMSILEFDPEWCAATLSLESRNTLIKKHNLQHGIVFCKTPLDVYSPYIEFKITMNIPCRGKSHIFIGLVDKSKYKQEHLVSTFWKDCPCSYYWDVWNTKLIKTDENGVQVGSVNGYGCQCEEFETRLSIKYDYKARTVSFFKNHLCLGVAFRNVQPGLTPSLDIWFESGTVEVMKNTSPQEMIYL